MCMWHCWIFVIWNFEKRKPACKKREREKKNLYVSVIQYIFRVVSSHRIINWWRQKATLIHSHTHSLQCFTQLENAQFGIEIIFKMGELNMTMIRTTPYNIQLLCTLFLLCYALCLAHSFTLIHSLTCRSVSAYMLLFTHIIRSHIFYYYIVFLFNSPFPFHSFDSANAWIVVQLSL